MENIYYSAIKTILVLAMMVAGMLLLYRYSSKLKLNVKPKGQSLQKVETIHMGYRKFISVVEIKGRVLVIGVGDKEMSLLAKWKKEEEEKEV